MADDRNRKMLFCKEEIKAYLGNCSDYMFRRYIELGMPALYADRGWIAHADNIDEWFKTITRVQVGKRIDQLPDESGTINDGGI